MRQHSREVRDEVPVRDSLDADPQPGLTELRLAVLGIIATIALTVGFGVPGPWYVGLGAGAASLLGAGVLIGRWGPQRRWLMRLAQWLIGPRRS